MKTIILSLALAACALAAHAAESFSPYTPAWWYKKPTKPLAACYGYTGEPIQIGSKSIGPDAGYYDWDNGSCILIAPKSAEVVVSNATYKLGEPGLQVKTIPEGLEYEIRYGPLNTTVTWENGTTEAPTKPGRYSYQVFVTQKNWKGGWTGINALLVQPRD